MNISIENVYLHTEIIDGDIKCCIHFSNFGDDKENQAIFDIGSKNMKIMSLKR